MERRKSRISPRPTRGVEIVTSSPTERIISVSAPARLFAAAAPFSHRPAVNITKSDVSILPYGFIRITGVTHVRCAVPCHLRVIAKHGTVEMGQPFFFKTLRDIYKDAESHAVPPVTRILTQIGVLLQPNSNLPCPRSIGAPVAALPRTCGVRSSVSLHNICPFPPQYENLMPWSLFCAKNKRKETIKLFMSLFSRRSSFDSVLRHFRFIDKICEPAPAWPLFGACFWYYVGKMYFFPVPLPLLWHHAAILFS